MSDTPITNALIEAFENNRRGDGWEQLEDGICNLESSLAEAVAALKVVQRFIRNGIDLGYIRMPDADCPDTAKEVPPMVDAIIAKHSG